MKSLFNKMRSSADILAADAVTTVLSGIAAGQEELSGRALELAQLHSSVCNVRFTVRYSALITATCIVKFNGAFYPIDYVRDPGQPAPDTKNGEIGQGQVMEIYAHRVRQGT